MTTEEQLEQLCETARKNLGKLSKIVLEGRKPPPGPYAFFHHNAHAMERLLDCRRVLKRLFEQRRELAALADEEQKRMPAKWPAGTPYHEDVQKVMQRSGELTAYMKQDLESLYMFGGILLDQWSLQAMAVASIESGRRHPFRELVQILERNRDTRLEQLWQSLHPQMLWLYYQLRFYRNRFVVHGNRPWQRGTTHSVYGDDFNLFTPTPPGWLDDKAINNEIQALLHLAPEAIRNAPEDHRERARPGALLERLFNNVGNIQDRRDREKVAELFGKKGGSTPTFQVLARNLFEYVSQGTELLIEVAKQNLAAVELGEPFKANQGHEQDDSTEAET